MGNRQTTQLDNPKDYLERNEVNKQERKGKRRERKKEVNSWLFVEVVWATARGKEEKWRR